MDETGKTISRRLFFALWPDAETRDALSGWQVPLHALCGGRVMRADSLHCTLVFLGAVTEPRMESLLLAAQESRARRFELRLGAAHYWGHNHIVYAAPDSMPQALAELVQELESNLRRHGFRFDARPYLPHVTLLRGAGWRDEPLSVMPEIVWPVRDFVLVQSTGDAQGTRYEVLARFAASELE